MNLSSSFYLSLSRRLFNPDLKSPTDDPAPQTTLTKPDLSSIGLLAKHANRRKNAILEKAQKTIQTFQQNKMSPEKPMFDLVESLELESYRLDRPDQQVKSTGQSSYL